MSLCQHCGRQHDAGTTTCPVTQESMNAVGLMGSRIDRYEVQKLLGAGGFGAVYLAKHVHTDALVAVKVLKKQVSLEPTIVERFLREAKAAAAVGSDYIVRVSDAGISEDGQAFLVMEALEGSDLKELASREGPLPPMRIVNLVCQVLEGLGAAHQRNIVHRDMKPANVFVTRKEGSTEKEIVKLLDFGVSKMHAEGETSGLTMSGMAMGTPSYMAPEQFFDARNVDGRADLYSVAVMLYELLSNRLPFEADSFAALIVKVRTEQAPDLRQIAGAVPPALATAVMRGLAKEKEQRWSTAFEFANALRAAVGLPLRTAQPLKGATSGAVAKPASDSASMMLGQTATPMPKDQHGIMTGPPRAQPAPVRNPATPNVLPSNSLQQEAQQQPVKMANQAPAGWVGQTPVQNNVRTPMPSQPQGHPGPPKKSNTTTIIVIVLVVLSLMGACCIGSIVIAGIQSENQRDETEKALKDTVEAENAEHGSSAQKDALADAKAQMLEAEKELNRADAPESVLDQHIEAMREAEEELRSHAQVKPTGGGDSDDPAEDPEDKGD